MPDPNIILTGFMGTGKTAVGSEVAARLGRPFEDMDDLIVQRGGQVDPGDLRRGRRVGFSRPGVRHLPRDERESGPGDCHGRRRRPQHQQ